VWLRILGFYSGPDVSGLRSEPFKKGVVMSYQGEVYYCGHCHRQQTTDSGEKCKICGRITVSWYTERESESEAKEKWDEVQK